MSVLEEMLAFAKLTEEDGLAHYGVGHLNGGNSGRYPWGSGEDGYQRSTDFYGRVNKMRKEGFTYTDPNTGITYKGDTAIAKSLGMSTTEFRAAYSIAKDEQRQLSVSRAKHLKEDGMSNREIAIEMFGDPKKESTVRSLLDDGRAARTAQSIVTADYIKGAVDEKGMIDVGKGVDTSLGISREKMNEAITILQNEGYEVYNVRVPQATNPGKYTVTTILCPPGTEYKEAYNFEDVHSLLDYDKVLDQSGESDVIRPAFDPNVTCVNVDRLAVRYANGEEGDHCAKDGIDGTLKDGVVEIRRGVADLDLGESNYAQVRIMTIDEDGNQRFIKGMAVYMDEATANNKIYDGVDLIFNSNKPAEKGLDKALKAKKDDPDNPFGALIKEHGGQSYYYDEDGNEHLSAINKRAEEGDWGDWSKSLPSQFLAKQSQALIDDRIAATKADKQAEYDEICSLTNPVVKKALLNKYALSCDSDAETLQMAALPRQSFQVILPMTTLKDGECYAPNYQNGEKIALVRYPHGGTFEIPILTVNNRNKEGIEVITPNAKDAIGIDSKTANRLSGADFDGDTAMVIPLSSSKAKIVSTAPLDGLKDFDTRASYGADKETTDSSGNKHYYRDGREYKIMTQTNKEMGIISNLITDMTIEGASDKELERAVRHSMVVIDAEKHKLDYKQSEKDNRIQELKDKYQPKEDGKKGGGASTLLSQAQSTVRVDKSVGTPKVDPNTGELIVKRVKEEYTDSKGNTKTRTEAVTKMSNTKDAKTLVSPYKTDVEMAYADYANYCKAQANKARLEALKTEPLKYDATAKKAYAEEVKSLDTKLTAAKTNAPKERQAQLIANAKLQKAKQMDPDMDKETIKKKQQQYLVQARNEVGAHRQSFEITDSEWDAIQSGAISNNKLVEIVNYCDMDSLRQKATPRTTTQLSSAQQNRIARLKRSGYTNAEIAQALGVSTSTVQKYGGES